MVQIQTFTPFKIDNNNGGLKEMPKFRKKPVVIEAIEWNGDNGEEICKFMGVMFPFTSDGNLMIGTLEGVMTAAKGDWIIKGVAGEFYPCKPDIFEQTYERIIVAV